MIKFFVKKLMSFMYKHKMYVDINRQGKLYLRRFIIARNKFFSFYIHDFHSSDPDVVHDHPWWFISYIVSKGYLEYNTDTKNNNHYIKNFKEGNWSFHRSLDAHMIRIRDNERPITIVFTGKRVREWGFYTKNGWIPHEEFLEKY